MRARVAFLSCDIWQMRMTLQSLRRCQHATAGSSSRAGVGSCIVHCDYGLSNLDYAFGLMTATVQRSPGGCCNTTTASLDTAKRRALGDAQSDTNVPASTTGAVTEAQLECLIKMWARKAEQQVTERCKSSLLSMLLLFSNSCAANR